jgi:transposase
MRPKQWGVQLTEEERQPLQEMLRKGTHNSRVLNRARILLLAHEGRYDHEVAHIMGVTAQTVAHVRKRYAQGGLEAALYDRPHRRRPPRLEGRQEAYVIALVQSPPPEGRQRWTLQLLADRWVALGVVWGISPETVRQVLKKRYSALGPAAAVHSRHRRGVRRPHGRYLGPLRTASGGRGSESLRG